MSSLGIGRAGLPLDWRWGVVAATERPSVGAGGLSFSSGLAHARALVVMTLPIGWNDLHRVNVAHLSLPILADPCGAGPISHSIG